MLRDDLGKIICLSVMIYHSAKKESEKRIPLTYVPKTGPIILHVQKKVQKRR
jgi:hypothetical protein